MVTKRDALFALGVAATVVAVAYLAMKYSRKEPISPFTAVTAPAGFGLMMLAFTLSS